MGYMSIKPYSIKVLKTFFQQNNSKTFARKGGTYYMFSRIGIFSYYTATGRNTLVIKINYVIYIIIIFSNPFKLKFFITVGAYICIRIPLNLIHMKTVKTSRIGTIKNPSRFVFIFFGSDKGRFHFAFFLTFRLFFKPFIKQSLHHI